MKFELAEMVRRTRRPRRRSITFRPITAPATMASDLYAAAYQPAVKAWEVAIPGILATYERALAAMTQDSPAEIGAVLTSTEAGIAALVVTIRLRLEAWTARLERYQRQRWRSAVLTATGVDVGTMIGAGDMRMPMAAAIERNVGLVRSVSEQARTRIGEAVFRGLQRRAPAAEVAKEIRAATGMARRRALNVASHQTTMLTAQLQEERAREAGIEGYAWVSSGKLNYRPEHKARNGKIYRWDEPPADGPPGTAINCGCTSAARLSLDPNDEF